MKPLDMVQNLVLKNQKMHVPSQYYGLLMFYGAAQAAAELESPRFLKKVIGFLDAYPDKTGQMVGNFDSYTAGGNGKAYFTYLDKIGKITLAKDVKERFYAATREYADKTLAAPKSADGILTSAKVGPDKVWIDVVTCVTPFMLFAGLALDNEAYVDFGAEQCLLMYELFLDKENGLLHQCRGFVTGKPEAISKDHWSRGNGWGYVGFADLIAYLPKTSRHFEKARNEYVKFTDALLKVQTDDGMWNQELTDKYAWHETSGTALILYGLGAGIRRGILKDERYKKAFQKGINALLGFIDNDFATYNSCPGCLCPKRTGEIAEYLALVPPKDEVHSYGAFILALTEAHRNGMEEI